jgi:hypothetical protein
MMVGLIINYQLF